VGGGEHISIVPVYTIIKMVSLKFLIPRKGVITESAYLYVLPGL
jgi:hypothetical protein